MKNYVGISRDHSGSMRSIAHFAMKDYNSKIESIKNASLTYDQDTIVSVVECGDGRNPTVRRDVVNSNVTALKPLTRYIADATGTPLFDSVGDLIEQFESTPDKDDPNVSFLVMAITDGAENASKKYRAEDLAKKINQLTATDRWTFVFRVPRGYTRNLTRLGIPEGNILEWDQTEKGVAVAAQRDHEAFTQYFTGRAAGQTQTQKFYTNLSSVTSKDVESTLEDISSEILIWPVTAQYDGAMIKDFVEQRDGFLLKGSAFYQLTKTEKVQDHKKILIRDRNTQAVYFGNAARRMLGVSTTDFCKLVPGNNGNFDVFIQSTSVNRKLVGGTSLIYWKNVGKKYKNAA